MAKKKKKTKTNKLKLDPSKYGTASIPKPKQPEPESEPELERGMHNSERSVLAAACQPVSEAASKAAAAAESGSCGAAAAPTPSQQAPLMMAPPTGGGANGSRKPRRALYADPAAGGYDYGAGDVPHSPVLQPAACVPPLPPAAAAAATAAAAAATGGGSLSEGRRDAQRQPPAEPAAGRCTWFRRSAAELAPLLEPAVHTPEDAGELFVRLSGGHPALRNTVPAACALLCGRGGVNCGRADTAPSLPELFAAIGRWALAALSPVGGLDSWAEPPWPPGGGPRRRAYTAAECRGMLANLLLLNLNDPVGAAGFKPPYKAGGLRLDLRMLVCPDVGVQKLATLLQYFATSLALEGTADDGRAVVFERRAGHRNLAAFKAAVAAAPPPQAPLAAAVALHAGGMEAVAGCTDAFVNFANPIFGYGEFIASCTQEEIMQICCPEFNVGMLFLGSMEPHEVVIVHGCRRYARYTGYLHTYMYAGPWEAGPATAAEPAANGGGAGGNAGTVQSILTMDACTSGHFTEHGVLRDVQKATLCFEGVGRVSTGRWGCGVFGGTPPHKFAQQLVAAALAGQVQPQPPQLVEQLISMVRLQFSTFGDLAGCDRVLAALAKWEGRQGQPVSGQQLLTALLACCGCAPRAFLQRFEAECVDVDLEIDVDSI